ncbi:MAG: MerR family transcriptional regulator [Pseudomonadota bacterium]
MADDSSEETWSIAEVSKAMSLTPRALRFYEQQGLVTPLRAGKRRRYTEVHRARLDLIVHLRTGGFSVQEVKDFLESISFESGMEPPAIQKQLDKLLEYRKLINNKINSLESLHKAISNVQRDAFGRYAKAMEDNAQTHFDF